MTDQASELRQLVRESSRKQENRSADQVRTVLVTSGRNGAGSTCVALNLATDLAQREYKTLLVDADGSMDNTLVEKAKVSFFQLKQSEQETKVEAAAAVRVAAEGNDYVVIDAGKMMDRTLWQMADLVLMVTTSELPVVMESYSLLKQAITSGVLRPIHVLVNMTDEMTASDVFARLDRAGQEFLGFRPNSAGYLSVSGELLASPKEKEPIVLTSPHSALSRQFKELTRWAIDQMYDRTRQLSRPRHPEEAAA